MNVHCAVPQAICVTSFAACNCLLFKLVFAPFFLIKAYYTILSVIEVHISVLYLIVGPIIVITDVHYVQYHI